MDWLSHRIRQFSWRLIGALFVFGTLSLPAVASNVQFAGSVGWSSDHATFAILTVDAIHNYDASGTSAALRVEFWASSQPFSGSFPGNYRLSTYDVGPLAAGSSTARIVAVVPLTPPPAGTWRVAMVVTEYTGGPTNDGYTLRNYLDFPDPFASAGPSDPTPPTVSITSPTAGNVSGVVTISASANDNVGVARVDFYIKGALVGSDSTAPYQYSWNTTSVSNGAASIYAKAFDAAGNSAQSTSVSVTVNNVVAPPPDTTPPSVSIASPIGGNVSGTVTISANASDNVGVTRVDFYVNGALNGSDSTAPYQYSWNTASVSNGTATIYAKAYDAAGNSTQSASVSVNVANVVAPPPDTTPPSVSIASPIGGNVSGTVTISANASDNVGVTRVDFYINGALVGSDSTAPYQYSWNTTSVSNGAATIYAKAFDAAGNSAQSSTVSVTVANVVTPPPDTTPPSVSIASPTGGNVSGVVAVSVNASDNVGVARVDLLVNGVTVGSDISAPYQFSWNSTGIANGAAQLKAVAYDAAGNLAQSAIVIVNVANVVAPPPPDTTPPSVSIASPTGGNVSGTVTVTASATDNLGVARVDLQVNGLTITSDASAPYQFSWNTVGVANGPAQLKAIAYDAAGNFAQSTIVTVNVANIVAPPPGHAGATGYAIEYYHAAFDHYFITASETDINALDSGQFLGWARTGYAFKVFTQPTGDANPVCRFYIPPALGDSHFYSASPAECADAVVRFPTFVEESGNVFYVNLPDPVTGACPANMVPVYRVWNNRRDSNHRYMTIPALRDQMVAKGYIAEGYGPDIVIMCSPM
jgi:Bacterial Ig domain